METYTTRSRFVTAVRVKRETLAGIDRLNDAVVYNIAAASDGEPYDVWVNVTTQHGNQEAELGDWIVQDRAGNLTVMSHERFVEECHVNADDSPAMLIEYYDDMPISIEYAGVPDAHR